MSYYDMKTVLRIASRVPHLRLAVMAGVVGATAVDADLAADDFCWAAAAGIAAMARSVTRTSNARMDVLQ